MLFEVLSDLMKVDNVLFIVRNNGAISEVKSNSLTIRKKDEWITIGENSDPAHLHIDSNLIRSCRFIKEDKSNRMSFSVGFFDCNGDRILGVFFTKMYDEHANLIPEREKTYEQLNKKYGPKIEF